MVGGCLNKIMNYWIGSLVAGKLCFRRPPHYTI